MKCSKCNADIPEDVAYCTKCGEKVVLNQEVQEETIMENCKSEKKQEKELKKAIFEKWKELNNLYKLLVILLIVDIVSLITALLFNKTLSGIVSIIQLVGLIFVYLMDKNIIKVKKNWYKYIIIIICVLLSYCYIKAFSTVSNIDTQEIDSKEYDLYDIVDWSELVVGQKIPPLSNYKGNILKNTDTELQISLVDVSNKTYYDYLNECKKMGYTIDEVKKDYSFEALSEENLKLTLNYIPYLKQLTINLKPFEKETEQKYIIDYDSAAKYEADLNNGVDTVGKIVRFGVISYHPDSALGYNAWAGEHLNFISSDDIKVSEKNVITGKVVKTNSSFGSWYIDYEVLKIEEKGDDYIEEPSKPKEQSEIQKETKNEQVNENTVEQPKQENKVTESDNKISVSKSASSFKYENYQDVVNEFTSLGFTNVKTKVIYDVGNGWFSSTSVGEVKEVSINGNNNFNENDRFDKNAKVIITYRDYETNTPAKNFTKYTANQLEQELDKNALKAKDKHEDELVEITGKLSIIDSSGKYIAIERTDHPYTIRTIHCSIKNDEQKEKVKKMKVGKKVTVRGKITSVGEVMGYSLDIYSIP